MWLALSGDSFLAKAELGMLVAFPAGHVSLSCWRLWLCVWLCVCSRGSVERCPSRPTRLDCSGC